MARTANGSEFISVAGLRLNYGLTGKWIRALGKPDRLTDNPRWSSGGAMRLYAVARVERFIEEHRAELAAVMERKRSRRDDITRRALEAHRAGFATDTAAIAHALFCAEELFRAGPLKRRRFEGLKDLALVRLQSHLTLGRISSTEHEPCDLCTEASAFPACPLCHGTGVRVARHLYEHHFDVDGQAYCFHSYIRPREVSGIPGADIQVSVLKLTAEERRRLLPLDTYLDILDLWLHPREAS